MKQDEAFLEEFREWFSLQKNALIERGFTVEIGVPTQGSGRDSIYADIRNDYFEWLAQLWETGEADFDFAQWKNIEQGVEVTHYEFQDKEELISSLEATLKRML